MKRAIADRRIVTDGPWLLPMLDQPPAMAGVVADRNGRCVFRQDHRCAVHAAIGHESLPAACQHFPRVCLIDDRGVFVTLSHACPTAAGLLISHQGPVRIVDGPEPVAGRVPEGLYARGTWPPLLTPGVLMDLASYSLWESHLVDWLGGPRNPDGEWAPADVLSMLVVQAQTLAAWRPGHVTLADAIGDLARGAPARIDTGAQWRAAAVPVNRFLAAHAFASWTAYQADGVVAQVNRLQYVLDVLRIEADRVCRRDGGPLTNARLLEAMRDADVQLRHLVESCRTKNEERRTRNATGN